MTLTNKREAFCKAIALEGLNQSDAYRKAYPTSLKWADKTVRNNAYMLMQSSDILATISELKEEIKNKMQEALVYTAKQSFDNLLDIQKRAKEKEVFKDELKAEELKGKIAGLYEEVHKFKGDKDAPFETNININFVNKKDK